MARVGCPMARGRSGQRYLEMSKQRNRRRSATVHSSKRPSKVSVLAELLRVTEQAGTMEISRDYFRANSRFRDKWNTYWCSFKEFLAAASGDDDLYYSALVELVDEEVTGPLSEDAHRRTGSGRLRRRNRRVPPLVIGTRDNAPQWQRTKPDPETNPLADLDCEKVPTWDQQTVQATPLRASTCAGS